MADEPDASGGVAGSYGVTADAGFKIQGVPEADTQVTSLIGTVKNLFSTLKDGTANKAQLTGGIDAFTSSINNAAAAVGGLGSTSPTPTYAPSAANAPMSADSNWMQSAISGSGGGIFGLLGSLATAPMTYAFNRVEANRDVTKNLSSDLSRVSSLSGTSIEGILKLLSDRVPALGTPEEITQTLNIGAEAGFANTNSPRGAAFYTGVRQMQQLTPGISAPQLASESAQYLGNTQSQKVSMMLTGGAMGGFGAGGVPKTLQEWAESILRWFEGQRPGADRGKAFTKEELSSQMFPGSNMSAWFSATGVPSYMQDYFWQYSIGKMTSGKASDTKGVSTVEEIVQGRGGDLMLAQKATQTANARRDFTMASTPGLAGGQSFYENYLTRESSDRTYANVMSQSIDKIIPKMLGGVLGQMIGTLPTPIAQFLMQQITNLPSIVSSVAGQFTGSMGGVASLAGAAAGAGDPEFGDIGDTGSYGPLGGTGTAGMTPSMASRVGAMMKANPNLQITSGFRDGGLQGRLHARGVGRTAPQGRSMHGRGLAADIGPASQYGWLVKNAGKFGLASGVGHGEPWHVGFPGTVPHGRVGDPEFGDIGDPLSSLIGGAASAMNPTNWWSGIQSAGSTVFDKLSSAASGLFDMVKSFGTDLFQGSLSLLKGDWTSLFGKGGPFNVSDLASNALSGVSNLMGIPTILNPLALASGKAGAGASATDLSSAFAGLLGAGTGGLLGANLNSSMDWSKAGSTAGGIAGAAAGGAFAGTPSAAGSVAQILQKYGATASAPANVSGKEAAILNVLNAEAKAGFTGDQLIAMAAIAGRESSWNPASHNANAATGDNSYGLWQINMLGSMGPSRLKQFGLSSYDQLLDAQTSANAAFSLSKSGSDLSPWGGYKGVSALHGATQFVEPVYNIAKANHFIGDPDWDANFGPSNSAGSTTKVVVQNSISISGGQNSSPANLRRTAQQLAAFTTDEIKKQTARST